MHQATEEDNIIRCFSAGVLKVNTYKLPDCEAQLVKCLTADPGGARSILAWSHTFVEIDH